MKMDVTVCDQCHERSDDFYSEKGWINAAQVSITAGRLKDGSAKTKYMDMRDKHFCGIPCFVGFIKAMK